MRPQLAAIADAVREHVPGVKVYDTAGAVLSPPAVVVGPPTLAFETYQPEATSATVPVAVVVASHERALEHLLDLVPLVAQAIHDHTDAVVTAASPSSWPAGGSDLPAYILEAEVS